MTRPFTTPNPIAISSRLQALVEVYLDAAQSDGYDTVWDCCCDHGYLGMKLLNEDTKVHVVFSDVVASITELVEANLQQHMQHVSPARYAVHCVDARQLPLNPGQKNLVILAGIGGELCIDVMQHLSATLPTSTIDYLCCATTAQFPLRDYLHRHHYHLKHESAVMDRRHLYEILLVSSRAEINSSKFNSVREEDEKFIPVSLAGNMWQPDNPQHIQYLQKLYRYYLQCQKGPESASAVRSAVVYATALQRLGCSMQ